MEDHKYIFTSGREHLSLGQRYNLLKTVVLDETAPAGLQGRVRLAATYAQMNLTQWIPAISKVECELMAWVRGGNDEWKRIRLAQQAAYLDR